MSACARTATLAAVLALALALVVGGPSEAQVQAAPACPFTTSGATCRATAGCGLRSVSVCSTRTKATRCKAFRYCVSSSETFCAFGQGTSAERRAQCDQFPECSWRSGSCVASALPESGGGGGAEPGPAPVAPAPTQRPTPKPTPVATTKPPTPTVIDTTRFNIALRIEGTMDPVYRQAFERAKAKWESIIVSDFPSTFTMSKDTQCGQFTATKDILVDDILLFVKSAEIDGEWRILGQAGPCIGTNTGANGMLQIRVGQMFFDSADLARLARENTLDAVILHEMGHTLGLGTLFQYVPNLLSDTNVSPVRYLGAGGLAGTKKIDQASGFQAGTHGAPYIEDTGNPGTRLSHWKEDVYDTELMTGYLDSTSQISAMTILALQDLGYKVDVTKADTYVWPSGVAGRRSLRGKGKHNHHGIVTRSEDHEEGFETVGEDAVTEMTIHEGTPYTKEYEQ